MLALLPEKKRQLLHEEWRERSQDTGSVRWRRLVDEVTVSGSSTIDILVCTFIVSPLTRRLLRMR